MTSDLIGKKFPVLDDGHIVLLDVMGDDSAIADAARTSYGKGTRKTSEDRDLLRYLMRHRHSTPFEMAEIKLHVRVPMDCWRQWIRHRTANVNEYSTRYSEAIDSAQATPPDGWRLQAKDNRQGSVGTVTEWPEGYEYLPDGSTGDEDEPVASGPMVVRTDPKTGKDLGFTVFQDNESPTPGGYLSSHEKSFHSHARFIYEQRLAFGVAREQARKDLPLSTYTEAVWKCDLRNILGFLALRMDSHAQQEIRAYADVIGNEIVAKLFPETWDAFREYTLGSVTLSATEAELIRHVMAGGEAKMFMDALFPNKRERAEAADKLDRLLIHKKG